VLELPREPTPKSENKHFPRRGSQYGEWGRGDGPDKEGKTKEHPPLPIKRQGTLRAGKENRCSARNSACHTHLR
jgi:hypothetical protein